MTGAGARTGLHARFGAVCRTAPIVAALASAAVLCGCDKVTTLAARVGIFPFEKVCARQLPPTTVDIATAPVDYTVDTTRSYHELTEMAPEAGSYDRALGLTLAKLAYTSSTALRGIEKKEGGRACVRPAISITLSLDPMTVFVANEYHGDGCREAVIMEHERKHVAVYSRFIEAVARELREAITADFGDAIFYATDRAQAEREIGDRLAVHLDPLMRDSLERVREQQRTVDTPEEYARVAGACGGMKID
jgi:hypothetical protein